MEPTLQRQLIRELLDHLQHNSCPTRATAQTSPCARYTDERRWRQEIQQLFKRRPQVVALASELPAVGDFLTRQVLDWPLLLTRTSKHEVKAFINVCRHRGVKLVDAEKGCKKAFTCPYHAWTWKNDGSLLRARLEDLAFPELQPQDYGLHALTCVVANGLVWVTLDGGSEAETLDFIRPLMDDFQSWGFDQLSVKCSERIQVAANWKLIVEGGIESYHFKVAHRDTIAPHFLDSLSSYQVLRSHMRSVLPRASLGQLQAQDEAQWRLREHANVLYNVFPATQFLLMPDHVAWVSTRPIAVDQTEITLCTIAPPDDGSEAMAQHWRTNQAITSRTLKEDFALNESTQAGLHTPVNTHLNFGRLEGALHDFNTLVEDQLPTETPMT